MPKEEELSNTSFEAYAKKFLRFDCEFHRKLAEDFFTETIHDEIDRVFGG